MTTPTEKKEKSLAEFVVIIALVGVMMAVFIKYFIKNESQFTRAGFTTIAQTFNTKVSAVHAQWMMDKQPNVVYLASLNKDKKQAVSVNEGGWIDVKQEQLPCEAIWLLVMEVPMNSLKFSVSAIEVNKVQNSSQQEQDKTENNECRYVLRDGSYFQYNRAKGKVSKVFESN